MCEQIACTLPTGSFETYHLFEQYHMRIHLRLLIVYITHQTNMIGR